MKYYNKKKEYRNTWTQVEGPPYWKMKEVKRWCQLNGSTDRFYFGPYYLNPYGTENLYKKPWSWFFENSQDALAFKLMWAGNIK